MLKVRKEVKPRMSLREIRRRIETIEKAISERQRMLNHAEQSEDPDQIVRIPLLRNEIQILENERVKLVEQIEALKKSLESRLPELEKAYLDAVKREKAMLREVYETCKHLENKIQQLRGIASEVHINFFIPYKNCSDELGVVAKSLHLLEVPHISQLTRWLTNFTDWVEKTRWAE
jgi:predicted  nucleic acid-binding Zn-ribbon protein